MNLSSASAAKAPENLSAAEAQEKEKGPRKPGRECPCCSICLVVTILLCNTAVLIGNYQTASSLTYIGRSSGGWARVGLGLAQALEDDLNTRMQNTTEMLTHVVEQNLWVTDMFDLVLSLVGGAAESALQTAEHTSKVHASLLQISAANKGVTHRKKQHGLPGLPSPPSSEETSETLAELIPGVIISSVNQIMTAVMDMIGGQLEKFFVMFKPQLEQVGSWITAFGPSIQEIIADFSTTMDKAQKIFDQVLSNLGGGGDGEDKMVHDTFTLFDTDGDRKIEVSDLRTVSDLYGITSLSGNKPEELVGKYDTDHSGGLEVDEYKMMTEDDSIPNIMDTVLRTYAKRLSEIAGQVESSKMRDEVAQAVVKYFQLVCSKNMTKVRWISQRLTNSSLPIEFTADIMAEMCMAKDDPNVLTTEDVGQIVVGEMYTINSDATLEAFDTMSNPEFWDDAGLDPTQQSKCVEVVTTWITAAEQAPNRSFSAHKGKMILLEESAEMATHSEILRLMPTMARKLANEKMHKYLVKKRADHNARRQKLFKTDSSQLLLTHLLGGVAATDGSTVLAQRMVASGVPAVPETLDFAKFLAQNASHVADLFQRQCFDYSGQSSSAMFSFSTMVQTMSKKVIGFIGIMEQYSTPAGIDRLQTKIQNFSSAATAEIMSVLETKLGVVIDKYAPALVNSSLSAVSDTAASAISNMVGNNLLEPMFQAVKEPLGQMIGAAAGNPGAEEKFENMLDGPLSGILINMTESLMTKQLSEVIEDVIGIIVEKGLDPNFINDMMEKLGIKPASFAQADTSKLLESLMSTMSHAQGLNELVKHVEKGHSLLELESHPLLSKLKQQRKRALMQVTSDASQISGTPEGTWAQTATLLQQVATVLPQAVNLLKNARSEVAKLERSLNSIFTTLQEKGETMFNEAAFYWRIVWTSWYVFLALILVLLLLYAFWAGGYMGGPTPPVYQDTYMDHWPPIQDDSDPKDVKYYPEELTCRDRMSLCCSAEGWKLCCNCCLACCKDCPAYCKSYHDLHLCLWSCIALMQVFCLILFLLSITLCVLGGVKALIYTGCSQIYVLDDNTICTETMMKVKQFLSTFMVTSLQDAELALDDVCVDDILLTCAVVGPRMLMSTILTVVGSLLGAVLSLQLLIETAILHERATWRRRYAALEKDEKSS